jgi:hypothetical protein
MSQMSPLAKLLVSILRWGSMGSAGLLVLFVGIFLWQKWTPAGLVLSRQDWGFLGVLVALLLLAVYLIRSIAKEIANNSKPPSSGT